MWLSVRCNVTRIFLPLRSLGHFSYCLPWYSLRSAQVWPPAETHGICSQEAEWSFRWMHNCVRTCTHVPTCMCVLLLTDILVVSKVRILQYLQLYNVLLWKNTLRFLRFTAYFRLDIDRIYHPWVITKQPTLLGFVLMIDNMQLVSGPVSVLC